MSERSQARAYGGLLTAIAAMLAIAGCAERSPAPRLEIVEATLTTSDGQYEFRARSFYWDADRDTYNLTLLAAAPGLRVWVAPFGLTSKMQVWSESQADVEFVTDNVFYEADYRDQRMLAAFEDEAFDSEGRPLPTLIYIVPDRLQNLLYTMSSAVIFTDEAADRIRSMRDEVHRFYFEFAVDGKPYVADIAIRLDVVMDVAVAVPNGGMP